MREIPVHGGASSQIPILTDAQVLRAAAMGTLPLQWRMEPGETLMHPTLEPRREIVVSRETPSVGSIVCLASASRIVWRRVLAIRDHEFLLRGEIAPFVDGWFGDVVGCVVTAGVVARLAKHAPSAWTALAWWSAVGLSHIRGARAVAVSRVRPRLEFSTRELDLKDSPMLVDLLVRAHGGPRERFSREMTGKIKALGLFAPDCRLVGRYGLDVRGDVAHSVALVVDPSLRGRGGGAALATAIVGLAAGYGARVVRCSIAARNLASIRAHRRAGFAATGRWDSWPDDPFLAAERQWLGFEAVTTSPSNRR